MDKLVVKILTVLFIISFIIAIPVGIVKNHVEKALKNMTLDETYICQSDHDIKLKFTEDFGNTPEGFLDTDDSRIVYLYVGDKKYYGLYKFDLVDKVNKVVIVTFYEGNFETARGIDFRFDYNKKKLIILLVNHFKNGFSDEDVFKNGQIFVKRTWWNTWGNKFFIIGLFLFGIWFFKDVPKMLKHKETIQEIKDRLRERGGYLLKMIAGMLSKWRKENEDGLYDEKGK